jgi:hypothetical protein
MFYVLFQIRTMYGPVKLIWSFTLLLLVFCTNPGRFLVVFGVVNLGLRGNFGHDEVYLIFTFIARNLKFLSGFN